LGRSMVSRPAPRIGRNAVTLRSMLVINSPYTDPQLPARRRCNLVFDLAVTHDRYGSSAQPHQNGLLTHPQDLDAPLHVAARKKISTYRDQYANNRNITFMPAITSTSSRMHCQPSDEGTERGGEGGIGGKGYTPTARVVAWPARGAEGAKAAAVPATAATARFCVSSFYRPTARPRRTSPPSACQRNNTATHFASAARHSTMANRCSSSFFM